MGCSTPFAMKAHLKEAKVGIVTQEVYPTDKEVRLKKIGMTLKKAGFEVYVFCPYGYSGKIEHTSHEEIHRLAFLLRSSKLARLLSTPTPFNILWIPWLKWKVRSLKIRLLIVRNLRLALPSVLVAKLHQIPIILDMSENYPALAASMYKGAFKTFKVALIKALELLCANLGDSIWVVIDENRDRLIKKGINPDKIEVVSNTPWILEKQDVVKEEKTCRDPDKEKGDFRIAFIGILTSNRGLDFMLNVLNYTLKADFNIKLVIIGDGPEKPYLENLARSLGIEKNVEFTGWIGYEKALELLRNCHVGVIPHEINDHTQTTIPNKLFDYMMMGLPVLSTNLAPVKRIIEKENCGLIMPDDPLEAAQIILKLKRSPELRDTLGDNGKRAIKERYNWGFESRIVLKTIKKLLNRG